MSGIEGKMERNAATFAAEIDAQVSIMGEIEHTYDEAVADSRASHSRIPEVASKTKSRERKEVMDTIAILAVDALEYLDFDEVLKIIDAKVPVYTSKINTRADIFERMLRVVAKERRLTEANTNVEEEGTESYEIDGVKSGLKEGIEDVYEVGEGESVAKDNGNGNAVDSHFR